ncbi:histidine phosphatase superfamily [Xylariomycetidae sp. FL0641]|nr:histidine phosphatase superfamily [Xylariomycetidae sp. FL0641]
MAPNSRIFLTRHAQAEHNVGLDYFIADAPLTPLGRKQAASLARQIPQLQQEAELVVSSPLRRTMQTTYLGWGPAMERLGGRPAVVLLPQAQECNDYPCDTGSPREALEADPEFAGFDFSPLTPDWTSKRGFWAADAAALAARARWVRQWLRERPEKNIVLVAHGDILRRITADPTGPSDALWYNAECRIFEFDPKTVDTDDCWLYQKEDVAAAGGYGPTSTELDIEKAEGRL